MTRWMILATLGATVLTGTAMAQQGAMKTDSRDRAISRVEFLARAEARFARVDTDKNGVLTREERTAARAAMRAARGERQAARSPGAAASPLAGMERLGGGRGGGGARMLARLDGDKDGRVSLVEFQASVSQRMQSRPLPAGVTAAQRNERLTTRFQRWDSNADGYVDQAEMASIQPRARRGAVAPSEM